MPPCLVAMKFNRSDDQDVAEALHSVLYDRLTIVAEKRSLGTNSASSFSFILISVFAILFGEGFHKHLPVI